MYLFLYFSRFNGQKQFSCVESKENFKEKVSEQLHPHFLQEASAWHYETNDIKLIYVIMLNYFWKVLRKELIND